MLSRARFTTLMYVLDYLSLIDIKLQLQVLSAPISVSVFPHSCFSFSLSVPLFLSAYVSYTHMRLLASESLLNEVREGVSHWFRGHIEQSDYVIKQAK